MIWLNALVLSRWRQRVAGVLGGDGFGPGGFVGGAAEADVGFVEDGENGFVFGSEFFHPAAVFILGRAGGVEEEQDDVGAGDESARGAVEHGAEVRCV